MDHIPYNFTDRVAGLMTPVTNTAAFGNTLWKASFDEHCYLRKTARVFIARSTNPKQNLWFYKIFCDSDDPAYKARYGNTLTINEFIEINNERSKYLVVNFLSVNVPTLMMKDTIPPHQIDDFFRMICLPLSNAMVKIGPNSTMILKHLYRASITDLEVEAYGSKLYSVFVQKQLEIGFLRTVRLRGMWPAGLTGPITKFLLTGKFLRYFRMNDSIDIVFPETFFQKFIEKTRTVDLVAHMREKEKDSFVDEHTFTSENFELTYFDTDQAHFVLRNYEKNLEAHLVCNKKPVKEKTLIMVHVLTNCSRAPIQHLLI
ncbi:hypothetical protein L596_005738 [Steinernema carpocapsae]|uniref:Uncharacterized protein n=1 Tax=Steinernema carpocapsae TaxID=34508 RepID=A0A4U8V1K2_STECR|nr:hypothetical protein L596_005738 [Steinernema carpocapsae]